MVANDGDLQVAIDGVGVPFGALHHVGDCLTQIREVFHTQDIEFQLVAVVEVGDRDLPRRAKVKGIYTAATSERINATPTA